MREVTAGAEARRAERGPKGERQNGAREALLQRTLADLIFDPSGGMEFDGDPVAFGEARGLESQDTAALMRFKDRLGVYRDLARASLKDPLLNIFPMAKALLAGDWEVCAAAFLAARTLHSPYYRDIAPTFVAWLAESGWGQERWPSLLALAHFEYVELMVGRWAGDNTVGPLTHVPSQDLRIVLSPGTQVLAYGYAVQRATVDEPTPPEVPTHLLGYQDPEGGFRVLELTPATAALLVRGQEESLGVSAASLGIADLDAALQLLGEMVASSAIMGFR